MSIVNDTEEQNQIERDRHFDFRSPRSCHHHDNNVANKNDLSGPCHLYGTTGPIMSLKTKKYENLVYKTISNYTKLTISELLMDSQPRETLGGAKNLRNISKKHLHSFSGMPINIFNQPRSICALVITRKIYIFGKHHLFISKTLKFTFIPYLLQTSRRNLNIFTDSTILWKFR